MRFVIVKGLTKGVFTYPPQKDGSLSAKPSTSAPATISSACDFELGLDLTAFRTVFSVAQLSPEFFDLDC
jgi:hypothetical protein